MIGWAYRREGGGVAPSLASHTANVLRDQAAIAKEARKAREEQAAAGAKGGRKGNAAADDG